MIANFISSNQSLTKFSSSSLSLLNKYVIYLFKITNPAKINTLQFLTTVLIQISIYFLSDANNTYALFFFGHSLFFRYLKLDWANFVDQVS